MRFKCHKILGLQEHYDKNDDSESSMMQRTRKAERIVRHRVGKTSQEKL